MGREKVINSLKLCAEGHHCEQCLYQTVKHNMDGIADCTSLLAEDALALLKEQEAKLLTFEEVEKHYHIPGELLGDIKKYVDYSEEIEPLYLECNIEDEWVVHWRKYSDIALYLDQWKEDYGKTWRCWTAKPTLSKRMEMKWE